MRKYLFWCAAALLAWAAIASVQRGEQKAADDAPRPTLEIAQSGPIQPKAPDVGLKGETIEAPVSVGATASEAPDYYDKTTDGQKIGWMQRGMDAARSKLRDPKSAQFDGVFFFKGADGVPMTCGKVNSKNGFGGYGGYQRFISAGSADLTFIEEQVADFLGVWRRFCQ